MISRTSAGMAAVVLASTLGLTACGDTNKNGTEAPAAQSVSQAAGSEATQEKMNLYVSAYNALIHNHWGVAENFADYQKLDIPNASGSSNLHFPEHISGVETAVDELKRGRAMNGGAQSREADAAVDRLVPQLEALLTQWRALDPYFESRAYRDDNLAKAKAAHPALMQAYQGGVAGIEALDAALSTYQRASNAAKMDAMRRAGHIAEASLLDAMNKADLFSNAVMADNIAEADRMLPELEAAIAKLREEQAKMPSDNSNKSSLNSIAGNLTSMVGSYRDFKQARADGYRRQVVERYNDAISTLNRVQLPA